jgi:hypothetical protein
MLFWRRLLGQADDERDPAMLKTIDTFTAKKIREICRADPDDINWTREGKLFRSDPETDEEPPVLFKGLDKRSQQLPIIFERLRNMVTNDKWPVVTLNDFRSNAHKTYLPFYAVAEQICFWFDPDNFCKGYTGGSSISGRPRVEGVLKRALGEQRYYAVMWYLAKHSDELSSTTVIEPKKFYEKKKADKDTDSREAAEALEKSILKYVQQFEHKAWYRLAACMFFAWQVKPHPDYRPIRTAIKKLFGRKVWALPILVY